MMDSDVLHVEEGKTNVLLTLDSTFCSFDCFVKTNERVIVAIGNRGGSGADVCPWRQCTSDCTKGF